MIDADRLIPENPARTGLPRRHHAELRAEEHMDGQPPKIENAPGLVWRNRGAAWAATWQARSDLVKRGFKPKSLTLWTGADLTEADCLHIADNCNRLQTEMLVFGRGGIPEIAAFDGTLMGLIRCYQADKDSPYHKARYRTREHYTNLLRRLEVEHGLTSLEEIKGRVLVAWHAEWSSGGRIAMAHYWMGMLRTIFGFGATLLEDEECERLCGVLHKMRFKMPKPRSERMTAEQATAIRAQACKAGLYSIALAQALQFELMLRQKDVIGEWIPVCEPGTSEVLHQGMKWVAGVRWSEIDSNLILRHTTSKRQKDIEVDLKMAGMVMEEFATMLARDGITAPVTRDLLPASGPMILREWQARPYKMHDFRRMWRAIADAAGVPKEVKNMDSRAGGITEATDAGAELEHVRHAATHGDISMTQRYSRGSVEKVANVMRLRAEHRNKK
jgi:hypothetical protein